MVLNLLTPFKMNQKPRKHAESLKDNSSIVHSVLEGRLQI